MGYRHPPWPHWLPPSSPSEIDTASRLTRLEEQHETKMHRLEEMDDDHRRMQDQLTLHERAILAIAGGLFVALQDKFPGIAAALKGILK